MAHFGRNQLSPNSIGFSPLVPGHTSDLNLNMVNGPPSRFPWTSPCQGLDRPVSGLIPVTRALSHPLPLQAAGDSLSLRLRCFSLATEINSLPRVSKRTI